jgi:hypothetical protein
VNLHACGQAKTKAATEPSRRMQAFLGDTLTLENEIASAEAALRNACGNLGRGLGLTRVRPDDSTRAVCGAVAEGIDALHAGLAPTTPAATGDARLDAALRVHLPGIALLRARAAGPLQTELHAWGRTAADLVAAGPEPLRPLGSRAACVFEQLVTAAARLAPMQASLTAQVEASAAIEAAARLPTG